MLADPTRRQVLQLLGSRPHRAGELADAAGMSPPAMSRHLRVLVESGVVEAGREDGDGRVRVFRLRPESLAGVQAYLDQVQMQWRTQLRSFKAHAEKRGKR